MDGKWCQKCVTTKEITACLQAGRLSTRDGKMVIRSRDAGRMDLTRQHWHVRRQGGLSCGTVYPLLQQEHGIDHTDSGTQAGGRRVASLWSALLVARSDQDTQVGKITCSRNSSDWFG